MKISWEKTKQKKGVLVAFNKTMQPLILWWYKALRRYSSLPIAFVDLGALSKNVIKWCKQNGYYQNLENYVNYFKLIKIPNEYIKNWEKRIIGNVALLRPYWFTKAISLMHTPFEKTLYLDIDCEVKNSIDDIFYYLEDNDLGICRESYEDLVPNIDDRKRINYNSGVIVYKKKSEIIQTFAKLSFLYKHDFLGDQDLLNYIIYTYNYKYTILPKIWNWSFFLKNFDKANILHYHAGEAKRYLFDNIIKKDPQLVKIMQNFLS